MRHCNNLLSLKSFTPFYKDSFTTLQNNIFSVIKQSTIAARRFCKYSSLQMCKAQLDINNTEKRI